MKDMTEVDVKKGTSYKRKRQEEERAKKRKKRSKRLSPYQDNERAKCANLLHEYNKYI